MADPIINPGQAGADLTYTLIWEEDFDVDGPGPGDNFSYDLLDDALNRAGNSGQDRDGNESQGVSVSGKRWAAWTDGDNDSWVYRQGGNLYVGGGYENAADPTRASYTHDGTFYDWTNVRLYAPYMVGQKRVYSSEVGGHIVDPTAPNMTIGPGHYIECRVSFEQMQTQAFRFSIWLMPGVPNESNAYDDDAANGVEIDIFEYENWTDGGFIAHDLIQQKVIGGSIGTTPNGSVDCSAFGLESGFHTIGLLWRTDGLYWHIDGTDTQQDTTRVPQTQQALQVTREINSGAKDSPSGNEIPSAGVKRPADPGLFARSAYPDRALIPTDKAQVDYIRVWSVDGDGGLSVGTDDVVIVPPESETRPTRDTYAVLGPDIVSVNAPQTQEAQIPEGKKKEDFTYLWTVSGAGEILSGATSSVVTYRATSSGDFTLDCDVNEII